MDIKKKKKKKKKRKRIFLLKTIAFFANSKSWKRGNCDDLRERHSYTVVCTKRIQIAGSSEPNFVQYIIFSCACLVVFFLSFFIKKK